jgi:hypothetical protein
LTIVALDVVVTLLVPLKDTLVIGIPGVAVPVSPVLVYLGVRMMKSEDTMAYIILYDDDTIISAGQQSMSRTTAFENTYAPVTVLSW